VSPIAAVFAVAQTPIVVVARALRSSLGQVAANRGALREWIAALCEWIAACLKAQPVSKQPKASAAGGAGGEAAWR
jgi:hypothetical protein